MIDLQERYFSEDKLGNYTLGEVGTVTGSPTQDPKQWVFVRARAGRRSGPYSEGIHRVLRTQSVTPLIRSGTQVLKDKEILERMPSGPKSRQSVPSIEGEYLTIIEVYPEEQEDGRIKPETGGSTTVIPVEYVIEPLSYDEVISELVSETL